MWGCAILIIVTGGAGFIGSAVVEHLSKLVDRGEVSRVLIIDNLYSGKLENISSFVDGSRTLFAKIDISNYRELCEALSPYLREFRGDFGVVHLAAIVNIVEVYENPVLALRVNVGGTLNMLELVRKFDARRFVFASSVAVYGEPRYLPIDEEHPTEPLNLYGETKLMGERLVNLYARDYGLSTVSLRFFNVYGPRMREGAYASVVHNFIEALLRKRSPVIYGDGRQTRDFVFVYDVAEATVKALLDSRYVGALNIGSGVEVSILDLLKTIERIVGYEIPPRFEPPRRGDVRRSCANISKAKEVLRWSPRHSLEEGLKITVEYYRKRLSATA